MGVLFESGLQHMVDRLEGYYELSDAVKAFLRELPNAWDDIKLLEGTLGRDVMIPHRKGSDGYVGGISAELRGKKKDDQV